MFCLLSKNKDCVIESLQETSEPERFFLDNFIPMSTLDSSLLLAIKSVKNGGTIIEKKEHENKYNRTKELYSDLKHHVGIVDCECSMEEWYLKDIVSKLTIEFLINYDSDKLHIFPDFVCWGHLYTTIEDAMDEEFEDDQNESEKYSFNLDRDGFKKLVMTIPYMLIEKNNVCPCCVKFSSKFFGYFSAPGPIAYFTCDCNNNVVFENQTFLLNHFKTETRVKEDSTINRFHQIFYIWLSLYNYCSTYISKRNIILCQASLPSLNHITSEEDNGIYCNPCQQCVTCETFGIVSSRINMSTLSSANNNQNNQYLCINTIKCRDNVLSGRHSPPEDVKIDRTLDLDDIQAFQNLVSDNYIPPTLACSITNYVGISCSTLKLIFKKLYNDTQYNKLEVFDAAVLTEIFNFLIPSDKEKHGDDSIFCKTERFFSTANQTKFDKFIDDQEILKFSCSYILSQDDEMSIKFRASQETVKWIKQTAHIPDMFSWKHFYDVYDLSFSSRYINSRHEFNYTKADYIHLASSLPYMMIEHLRICPCDPLIDDKYWEGFDCCNPFKQDQQMCMKPKSGKKHLSKFSSMNDLLKHLKNHNCNHHNIVFQYLTFYLRLKDKQSFLSKQLKDVAKHNEDCFYSEKMKKIHINNMNVTTFNMNYLLNTSYHHQEMLRNITSMFSVIETKTDWSSGYLGILYCLRSVHECDETYTMFKLRCDMRDKLIDKPFMKKLKASLNNVDDNICKKDSLKDALIAFKKNVYVKGMEKRKYLTKEHKFDDKLGFTVLSLMYPTISFYCYSPLDFDLFIYKYDHNKQQTEIIRTHIYEKSSTGKNGKNIFLMKHPTRQKKVGLFQCLMPKTEEMVS